MSRETASHVRYIDRTRAYYEAEGYAKPYEWAHFDHIPFTPFASVGKPLSQCRVGVVTTSEMARRGVEAGPDDPRRLVYALPTDIPVEELYSRKEAYDRYATTLHDVESSLPLTPPPPFLPPPLPRGAPPSRCSSPPPRGTRPAACPPPRTA